MEFKIKQIGTIVSEEDRFYIKVDEAYRLGLKDLKDFGHIQVVWWFSLYDDDSYRNILVSDSPYKKGPNTMGVFATRSPLRPNPIALTVSEILHIDEDKGIIEVAYIDANDGTPLLDIKPYTPSFDRIEKPRVPAWCAHWPNSSEESGMFDWSKEMDF